MIQIRSVVVQSALAAETTTAAAENTALPPASSEDNAQLGKTTDASLFATLGEPAIAHSVRLKPDPHGATPAQSNDPLAAVALNPQPLPPRAFATPAEIADPLLAAGVSHGPRIPHVPAMPNADWIKKAMEDATQTVKGPVDLIKEAIENATQTVKTPIDLIKEAIENATATVQLRPESARPSQVDNPRAGNGDPREAMLASAAQINDALAAVSLNPQPLPPRDTPDEVDEPSLLARVRIDPSSVDVQASNDLSAQDRIGNFEIQQQMSDYNQAEQLQSSVQKKLDDTHSAIIGKIG